MTQTSKSKQPKPNSLSITFNQVAKWTARASGHPTTFIGALVLIIAWAATGPLFGFSDTWQLVINTTTTIATFLMVFLIQNTQNRDAEAMQVKVDELIRANGGARNALLNLEEMDEEEINELRQNYIHLAEVARKQLEKAKKKNKIPGT